MSDLLARRAVACLWLLVLAGCGSGRDVPSPVPPGIDLPLVGTLGRQPAGPGTIVVDVTADGRITLDGKGPLSLVGLRDEMVRLTADARWRGPDRSSLKILLVRADADLPWAVSQWIMQTACEPESGLYRIAFGARSPDGAVGAVGWRLPKERWVDWVDPPPHLALTLLAKGASASRAEDILPALRAAAGDRPLADLVLDVKAPATDETSVPTGFVVQVVDVALRAGVRHLYFEGRPPPPLEDCGDVEALLARVAALRAKAGSPTLRVHGARLDPLPASEPVPASQGLLARLYGAGVEPSEPRPRGEEGDVGPERGVVAGEPIVEEIALADLPYQGSLVPLKNNAVGAFPSRLRPERGRSNPVEAALTWLAKHQSPDGGWSAAGFGRWCDRKEVAAGDRARGGGSSAHDVGATGLALCAFLGAGYTNRGRHPFAKTVSRGLRHLKNVQDAEGCFGPRTPGRFVYDHAAASLAMVEAFGMTGSPIFKGSAQKALDFIALARNPYFGWRYGVKPGDSDTSVTAWMTMPLIAARWIDEDAERSNRPGPLAIDDDVCAEVLAWLDSMTDPQGGRTGYAERGGRPDRPSDLASRFPPEGSESTTAAALAVRLLLGQAPDSHAVTAGAALLEASPPRWDADAGTIDPVYWYFGSQAMFQVGGPPWETWNAALRASVLGSQRRDTDACRYLGSWDPIGVWGGEGGRVVSTALLTVCLEAEYRYGKSSGVR